MIAKVHRPTISSVGVVINPFQLFLECGPSLASNAAPALTVDMMAAGLFANCYRAIPRHWLSDDLQL